MSGDAIHDPPSTSLVAGKYELLGLIGRGGMGSVWEGRHTSLGTRVAIKFIDAEYANSQDARSRFDNEARAAATIQSKHAIQIFDHGTTSDGRLYIVMELLEGEPLDKRLARVHVLSIADTARTIRQVGRALQRAHDRGIIHRDLKPENIFLVRGPDDDEDVAKVLDFGIAKIKAAPGAVGVSSSTKTGTLLGTPFFMSPEQARGLRTVDHRSDLWSLGVIVFKCVTGVLPFDGESLGDLLVKICTVPIPLPSHLLPGLPPEFDAWITRALDRDPDRRFQTAGELAEALATLAGVSVRRDFSTSGSTASAGHRVASSSFGSSIGTVPAPIAPFHGSDFVQPIPAATSAPFTASASSPTRGTSRIGIFGAAAFGLLLGVGLILFKYGATKPASSSRVAAEPTPANPFSPASSSILVPQVARHPALSSPSASSPPLLTAEVAQTPAAVAASSSLQPVRPTTKLLPWKPPPKAAAVPAPLPPAPPAAPATPPKPSPNVGEPGY
jgi:serine/threonine-protein kinase